MNKFLLSVLFFSLLSCSQKKEEGKEEETPQQQAQTTQESSEPSYFQSEQYPLRIDYLPEIKMWIDSSHHDKYGPGPTTSRQHLFSLYVDISDEFPPGDPWEADSYLFAIEFYPTGQNFLEDFLIGSDINLKDEIIFFGNIPASYLTRLEYPDQYILLIPGIYASITLTERDIRKADPKKARVDEQERFQQITQQMLSRIHWLKSIDSNSQEFKTWKQHILDLIKEANKAENK